MAIEEIKAAITEFIDVIEKPKETIAEREKALAIALDKLILFKNFAPDVFDNKEYPDSPNIEHELLLKRVKELFPEFGFYNAANSVTDEIAETELVVGDALDDICDIYKDLKEVQWRFENTSENDALWHFGSMIGQHWLQHALFLRLYIFFKRIQF
ncbi:MAG TPA: DUF5063 domain-containing protein [Patescibacteria group bacterium]|nr:DUF5063 domain-containing protein [Patescibacteria group bacterium]